MLLAPGITTPLKYQTYDDGIFAGSIPVMASRTTLVAHKDWFGPRFTSQQIVEPAPVVLMLF